MTVRFPRPLRPGDRIGVTAPSSGVQDALRPRLDVAVRALRERGYEVVLGECLDGSGVVSSTRQRRAAELTAMLTDPTIAAVVPPWGGELAIDLLAELDWTALAAAEPTWLVGYSDLTTLMLPAQLRLGWATLHGGNLMDTPDRQPDGVLHWLDVAESDGSALTQRAPGRHRSARWPDWEADPGATDLGLDTEGRWEVVGGGGVDVTGRLVGGCIEVLGPLAGTPYGDLAAYGREHADEGLVVFVEAAEESAYSICRALHGMRLAGWFDHAEAVLVGRTSAPDSPHLTQRAAVRDALGSLDVPLVLDVDLGHVAPRMPLVTGAVTEVVVDARTQQITQTWP